MAKAITDATFEIKKQRRFGLGRLLGNLVWAMPYTRSILDKLPHILHIVCDIHSVPTMQMQE